MIIPCYDLILSFWNGAVYSVSLHVELYKFFMSNGCQLKDYLESPCRLLGLYFQIVVIVKEVYTTFEILSFALTDKNENLETR